MSSSALLTAVDVAARLQVSTASAYRLMAEMNPIRVGRRLLRVAPEDLDRFLADHRDVASASALHQRSKTEIPRPARYLPRADPERAPRPAVAAGSAARSLLRPIAPRTKPKA